MKGWGLSPRQGNRHTLATQDGSFERTATPSPRHHLTDSAGDRESTLLQLISEARDATYDLRRFKQAVEKCATYATCMEVRSGSVQQQLRDLLFLAIAFKDAQAIDSRSDGWDVDVQLIGTKTGPGVRPSLMGVQAAARARRDVLRNLSDSQSQALTLCLDAVILKCRRVQAADILQGWGLTAVELEPCLKSEELVGAFGNLFDASALHPRFDVGPDEDATDIVEFAPIGPRHSRDLERVVHAMRVQGRYSLACLLVASHVQEIPVIDCENDAVVGLLRQLIAIPTQGQDGKPLIDKWGRGALARMMHHLRLLTDCGLVPHETTQWPELLDAIEMRAACALPPGAGVASLCRLLGQVIRQRGTLGSADLKRMFIVAGKFTVGSSMGDRRWIRTLVARCPTELAALHDMRVASEAPDADVVSILGDLTRTNAPFTLRIDPSGDVTLQPAELDSRQVDCSFRWARHAGAYLDFIQLGLSKPATIAESEVEQAFRLLLVYAQDRPAVDKARLLALSLRALGRMSEPLELLFRDHFEALTSDAQVVAATLEYLGPVAFIEVYVELAACTGSDWFSRVVKRSVESMLVCGVFVRSSISPQGRQALDSALCAIVESPALLRKYMTRRMLTALLLTEQRRPPSRLLLSHPVLRTTAAQPDAGWVPPRIECLLLLSRDQRLERAGDLKRLAEGKGCTLPRGWKSLFKQHRRDDNQNGSKFLGDLQQLSEVDASLRLAMAGAAAVDSLERNAGLSSEDPVAGLMKVLFNLLAALPRPHSIPAQVRYLVHVMRLAMRLLHGERCTDLLRGSFRGLIAPTGSQRESIGEQWQFGVSALLAYFYLDESESTELVDLGLPQDSIAVRLGHVMCAAFLRDANRGLPCRWQLDQAMRGEGWIARRRDDTDMGVVTPAWFDLIQFELGNTSHTLPG